MDRDHAVGQGVQVAAVLMGDVVGGVPLLAVPRLVQTQHEGRVPQRLAHQLQPLGAHRLHGPVGVGQAMVQRLGVSVDRRAQAWQRLVPGLGQPSKMHSRALLAVPHVVEQAALLGALLVDAGHRGSGWAHAGHGDTSFWRPCSAHRVPNMTNEGHTVSHHTVVERLSAPAAGSRLGGAANYNGMVRRRITHWPLSRITCDKGRVVCASAGAHSP